MKNEMKNTRIWELDFLRGIALILMIYFHIIFDMRDIFGYKVVYSMGINYYIGRASAILFILISGISSNLSRNNIKRGLKVLGIALLITAGTYSYSPDMIVKFGILHFLGLSMIIYPIFQKLDRYILLFAGAVIIAAGSIASQIIVNNDYFFILGVTSADFFSADYYPLIPWFGVFLCGAAAGKLLYSSRKSLFSFSLKNNLITNAGRHTLLYYLIHQPIIILILTLVSRI